MDDGLRLLFLLTAGVLPLMALRDRLSRRAFALLAGAYVLVAAVAVIAFVTLGPSRPTVVTDGPLIQT